MLMRLLTLLLSVFLVANAVGCCLRAIGGQAPEPDSSPSASESLPPDAAVSVPESGSAAPESGSAAPEPQALPERLTLAELLALGDSDTAEIYLSANGDSLSVATEYVRKNSGLLGVDTLQKVAVDSPAAPEDTAYVSVACGDVVFYIFKGAEYGRLDAAEQTAYYSLPSGLYSKIQLAMMLR